MFGDLGVGDGDKSLTMFGWDVTPNHHKLALQFGVLDNFYDSGEVSGDGHVWSTAAITSDYHERVLAPTYKGRAHVRLRRQGRERVSAASEDSGCRRAEHGISVGERGAKPSHVSALWRVRGYAVVHG